MVLEVNDYLLDTLNNVQVLDIEIEGYEADPTYFFYISSNTYNQLCNRFFPNTNLLQSLVKTYNGCLFKIEYKDDKVEILIGFELKDHTLTIVFNDNYQVVDIKYYTLIKEVGRYKVCYKVKLSDVSSLYYNYKSNDIWTSHAPPVSMYTDMRSPSKYKILRRLTHLRKEYIKQKDVPTIEYDEIDVISRIKDYQDILTYVHSNLDIKKNIDKLLQLLIVGEYDEFIKEHSLNYNN